MKREGRQHGMVQTYPILPLSPLNQRPDTNFVNLLDSPPTAGLFAMVSRKSTNHSKFTGKCGQRKCSGCHLHPACKSKDKVKGTQKLKSCNASSNYRLMTWRDVDSKPGSSMGHVNEEDDYMDHDGDGVEEDSVNESGDVEIKNGDDNVFDDDDNNHGDDNIDDDDDNNHGDDNIDDDDNNNHNNTSYCDMGLWWEQVEGDEG